MLMDTHSFPELLKEQRGKRYRAKNQTGAYVRRSALIVGFALHLKAQGKQVTHDAIRAMLQSLDRDYSTNADQISRALAGLYAKGTIPKMPNGRSVSIDGVEYPSARSAGEVLGISPQTVLNRIASPRSKWTKWTRQTVFGSVSAPSDTE